jgi:hypothetical protein
MILIVYLSFLYKTLGLGSWDASAPVTGSGSAGASVISTEECSVDECPLDKVRIRELL